MFLNDLHPPCQKLNNNNSKYVMNCVDIFHRVCVCTRSMSEDERESGCDTVDGSPASDSSGRVDSPFLESRYMADGNQNSKSHMTAETEMSKAPVRTMVVPPMRVQNNNNEPAARAGTERLRRFTSTTNWIFLKGFFSEMTEVLQGFV